MKKILSLVVVLCMMCSCIPTVKGANPFIHLNEIPDIYADQNIRIKGETTLDYVTVTINDSNGRVVYTSTFDYEEFEWGIYIAPPEFAVVGEIFTVVVSGEGIVESRNFTFLGENKIFWEIDDNGVLTISGTGDMYDYNTIKPAPWSMRWESIKSVVIDDGITSIGSEAFYDCVYIKSVKIPDSVTKIGSAAFRCCERLESIVIPNTVTEIGSYAFYYCTNLQEITIPESVSTISEGAFFDCSNIRKVILNSSTTIIEKYAFEYCDSLVEITISGRLERIGEDAFHYCNRLKYVYINDIEGWCGALFEDTPFRYGEGYLYLNGELITDLIIPQGVTSVGTQAFYNCKNIESVKFPSSTTSIGDHAFDSCKKLTTIVMSDSIVEVGVAAFSDCSALESVKLSNKLTDIPNSMFDECKNLKNIIIPSSVENIGYDAFYSCSTLAYVYYPGSENDWSNISIEGGNRYLTDATVYYNYLNSSSSTNGKDSQTVKLSMDALVPNNDATDLPPVLDLGIYFNTNIKMGSGEIRVKEYKTDKTVKTFDISEADFSSNNVVLSSVELEAGKSYYVTVDSGAICDSYGNPFYGINKKNVWHFSTAADKELQKTTYVGLTYPQKGSLWWKSDNTDLPPIPSGSDSDYGRELDSWAREYSVDDVYYASNKQRILDMAVKIPVTDTEGQTFLLNDGSTTVKQVMQDLIFIEHLQPYIEKIDGKISTIEDKAENIADLSHYGDEEDIYNLAEDYAVQLKKYVEAREGKEKSSFFLSVAAPLAYTALINTVTKNTGEQESQFIRTFADANIKEMALEGEVNSVMGATDYETYKQGLSDIKNYTKIGKELYKITTNGVSKSTVKLGVDMLNLYFSDRGIGVGNETLGMISDAWSEFSTAKSAIKMSMFLGNSLGFFPYVVDIHTSGTKKINDRTKAWYFIADYYIDEHYPYILDVVYDGGYVLDKNYGRKVSENYSSEINRDIVLKKWARLIDQLGMISNNTVNIIGTRRDMVNAANVFRFAKSVDVEAVKESLLHYISAELNRGKTTEVYGMCPIEVRLYDKDDNLIATLSSEKENDAVTEYGSFYLLGDEDETKFFVTSRDEYRVEIVPYDEGEMTVSIVQKDENGEILESSYYENVSIKSGEVYGADLSLDKPVLTKESELLSENEAQAENIVIALPKSEVKVGETVTLSAEVYPDYSVDKSVEWSVDDETVASVDETGSLCGISAGEVVVTATAENGVSTSKAVVIYEPITSIDADVTALAMIKGEEYEVEITATPETADSGRIEYASSDMSVAAVDEMGVITARGKGEAIVTAQCDGVAREIYVTVSESLIDIVMYQSDTEGDRIKLDITNMSCIDAFSGEIWIVLYDTGQVARIIKYPVALDRQEELTDYVDIELNGKDYTVKAFLWEDGLKPLQKFESIELISALEIEE